jgi:hypothetical protein
LLSLSLLVIVTPALVLAFRRLPALVHACHYSL